MEILLEKYRKPLTLFNQRKGGKRRRAGAGAKYRVRFGGKLAVCVTFLASVTKY